MDTNRVSLIITIEEDCSSVKFKGECDGAASEDQSDVAAAIYAAVSDIAANPDTLEYFLEMAAEMAKELNKPTPPSLRLVN
jgi:hypothetical protein|tara:strand:+ start:560 stop:802 length:243 start_codon:yes stop_codon:yes gene_type:complete